MELDIKCIFNFLQISSISPLKGAKKKDADVKNGAKTKQLTTNFPKDNQGRIVTDLSYVHFTFHINLYKITFPLISSFLFPSLHHILTKMIPSPPRHTPEVQGVHQILFFFKNSRKFATSPSPAANGCTSQ